MHLRSRSRIGLQERLFHLFVYVSLGTIFALIFSYVHVPLPVPLPNRQQLRFLRLSPHTAIKVAIARRKPNAKEPVSCKRA